MNRIVINPEATQLPDQIQDGFEVEVWNKKDVPTPYFSL
jgi:hypothetical protein